MGDTVKGQVISGEFGKILVRQKSDAQIEIGELLIGEAQGAKLLLQAYDLSFGSQISQQNLELISGMFLEQQEPVNFFEANIRNYTIAHMKTVLSIKSKNAKSAKTLPSFFSTVREVTQDDLSFLTKPAKSFSVGKLRSGSKILPVDVFLETEKVLSHHILIPATTGKGKSNLMHTMLWNLLESKECAMLVFDPHDEYFGRTTLGLKDHPLWKECAAYYTPSTAPAGAFSLKIHISQMKPKHFAGVADFSPPQQELIQVYYNKFGEQWIEALLTKKTIDYEFNEGTYGVVVRRIARLLDLNTRGAILECSGIYSTVSGLTTLDDISRNLEAGKTVIVDTSSLTGQHEIFLSSLITNFVFDRYKRHRKDGSIEQKPVISIVLEEAPRVLGKEALEKGNNVFATIAREGRKFKVGLCAITQLPSLIPKEILANMNTKIILGLEMAPERNAIIESAAQDLSDDSRNIASLDKGEAIITSNFTRFATPIYIPLFEEVVTQTKVEYGKKANSKTQLLGI